ncbi:hypothetical protein [Candidatus Aciduliprofundum boonei]|uniref:hypothetical protein n=1 Tax=Candidatus Aciduliprofundum boonei TaxID=379547 RepID=UPI00018041F8|nr:hypothetical protein [Candidatus Aciduliprofundum boonei]EDY35648.1 hypothetical protein ABOONEI_185 [Aciduliprofundum boonei T469]HII54510.1 hypothetical protein [Candidatus Aciduliprofundum boonei]
MDFWRELRGILLGYEDLNKKYEEMGGRYQVPSSRVNSSRFFNPTFVKIWK